MQITEVYYANFQEDQVVVKFDNGNELRYSIENDPYVLGRDLLDTWLQSNTPTAFTPIFEIEKNDKLTTIAENAEIAATTPIPYGGKTYSADGMSASIITNMNVLLNAGQTLPTNFKWKATDGTVVNPSEADVRALGKLILEQGYHAWWTREELFLQVFAATTIPEIEAIPDWQ